MTIYTHNLELCIDVGATVSYDSWRNTPCSMQEKLNNAFRSAFEASAQTAAKLDPGAAGFQGSPWHQRVWHSRYKIQTFYGRSYLQQVF